MLARSVVFFIVEGKHGPNILPHLLLLMGHLKLVSNTLIYITYTYLLVALHIWNLNAKR